MKRVAVRRRHGVTPGARAVQPRVAAGGLKAEPANSVEPVPQPTAVPTYHGGPLVQNVAACAVFVGEAWSHDPAASVARAMQSFVSFFVSSELIAQLAIFNDGGFVIAPGTVTPPVFLPGTQVAEQIEDGQIKAFLNGAVASGDVPPLAPDRVYIVFMPEGVTVHDPGNGFTCTDICGYHSAVSDTPYIVVPFLACDFCRPENTSVTDAMTAVLSHELCETITNPFGTAWFADTATQQEVGDLCNDDGWSTKRVGGFLVQRFCMPNGVCF